MKNIYKVSILALIFISVLSSCGEDPPPPVHPMSGSWYLSSLSQTIQEPGYFDSNWQVYQNDPRPDWVQFFGTSNTLTLIFGNSFEQYSLGINNDNSYLRTFQFSGPDESDDGTWELDEENSRFFLNPTDAAFPEEYDLVGNIEDNEFTLGETLTEIEGYLTDEMYDSLDLHYPRYDENENLIQENDAIWVENEEKAAPVTIVYWWIFKRE